MKKPKTKNLIFGTSGFSTFVQQGNPIKRPQNKIYSRKVLHLSRSCTKITRIHISKKYLLWDLGYDSRLDAAIRLNGLLGRMCSISMFCLFSLNAHETTLFGKTARFGALISIFNKNLIWKNNFWRKTVLSFF